MNPANRDPVTLIRHVREKGGFLRDSGCDLIIDVPVGTLGTDVIEALRKHKAEVVAFVESEGGQVPPLKQAQQRNTA